MRLEESVGLDDVVESSSEAEEAVEIPGDAADKAVAFIRTQILSSNDSLEPREAIRESHQEVELTSTSRTIKNAMRLFSQLDLTAADILLIPYALCSICCEWIFKMKRSWMTTDPVYTPKFCVS